MERIDREFRFAMTKAIEDGFTYQMVALAKRYEAIQRAERRFWDEAESIINPVIKD